MKAAWFAGSGLRARLQLGDIAMPTLRAGEVLVRVHAAGVNPDDARPRRRPEAGRAAAGVPYVPGVDIAGVVAELGPETMRWEPGQAVVALLDDRHGGGYAEYAVADERAMAALGALPYEVGAALPRAGLAALQGLRDCAGLQPNDHLLINGASGGVGHLAVQLAKADLARISAVAGAGREQLVLALGADRFLDYMHEDFTLEEEDYDVIFDVAGVRRYEECERVLQPNGVYVTTAPRAEVRVASLRIELDRRLGRPRPLARGLRVRVDADDLAGLVARVEAGTLRVVIDRVDSLAGLAQSLSLSDPRGIQGKRVIAIP